MKTFRALALVASIMTSLPVSAWPGDEKASAAKPHDQSGEKAAEMRPMDGFTLASKLVESLAWPLIALIGLLMFRRPLALLLARLKVKSLEFAGLKLELDGALAEAEKMAEAARLPGGSQPTPDGGGGGERMTALDHLRVHHALLLTMPYVAMMETWTLVQQERNSVFIGEGREIIDGLRLAPVELEALFNALSLVGKLASQAQPQDVTTHHAIRYDRVSRRYLLKVDEISDIVSQELLKRAAEESRSTGEREQYARS